MSKSHLSKLRKNIQKDLGCILDGIRVYDVNNNVIFHRWVLKHFKSLENLMSFRKKIESISNNKNENSTVSIRYITFDIKTKKKVNRKTKYIFKMDNYEKIKSLAI